MRTLKVDNVAQAYLELLEDRGVDFFFANAGTDFASLVDAFARREADGKRAPRPIVAPHESVAVGMAHGVWLATGRPQAVMVHVTVGTANAACGIITAARSQAPMLMSAGRTPITEEGLPGSRDLYIHWAQESFDQAAMLREYVKWDYELRTPAQLEAVVDRALELTLAEPRGPVYLTLPREVLAAPVEAMTITSPSRRHVASRRLPDPARLDEAARLLARARRPLALVSSAGRDPAVVPALVAFAEAAGIGVVEVDPTHVNFPQSHPLHVGFTQPSGTDPAVAEADVLLVIDADVPWYPSLVRPPADAAVIHLAVDPSFSRYPMRSFPCDVPIAAHPAAALPPLAEAVRRHADPGAVAARRAVVEEAHRSRRARWAAEAEAQAGWPRPGFAWVTRRLQEVIDESTIVVNEYPIDRRHLAFDRPGAFFGQPHSSGLGWALPAALGIKLGAPDRTVIAALGDGAYLFNEPVACHLAARQQGLPVLTVIYNNQQWEAVKQSTLAVHPDGHAQASGRFPLTSLGPAPRYEEIVRAFDGHGERVETPAEVGPALRRALAAVREGRQAVVNVLCGRARD
ncbi:MAG TPA: thiamine pyrophosphate-requiring protein [Methylomirabilota bacterium]|jgi:acetolactate synthase I/II/III large subunit|nr:thiamine pyrophosphate-requiring protein [Methylomirabilota bacterium]